MKTKSRRLNIGLMKQRIELQAYSLTADGLGGNTQTWNTLANIWANITPVNGTEALEIGGLKGKTKYKILTRYKLDLNENDVWNLSNEVWDNSNLEWNVGAPDENIDPLMRIVYKGKYFNIQYAIDKGEEGALTEMMAIAE